MSKKIIAVLGATGAQGGGLVRAILDDSNGEFAARAITRTRDSEKAKALEAEGVEVVEADLDNVESLTKAFEGAHGVFGVTNFWEHFSPEKEGEQARNIADAARAAGVKHVVWSTLEDTRRQVPLEDDRMPTLMGKYKVPHFDAKGEADEYFTASGVPTTLLRTSFYWDNFVGFGMGPQRGEDGTLGITFPLGESKLSGIAAADIGPAAYGIFKRGEELVGTTVGIAGGHLSGAEMADAFTRHLGEPVRYNSIEPEVYRSFDFPAADDLGNMFQYYRDFDKEFAAIRDVDATRELNPSLQSFDQWLEKNAEKLRG